MKKGDTVMTPRFLTVRIEEVFLQGDEAWENGYREPTHYVNEDYAIYGKVIGTNRMIFAAVRKNK